MKKHTIFILMMGLVLISFTGCSKNNGSAENDTIPPALTNVASQFRVATADDRKELGEKLQALLPSYAKKPNKNGLVMVDYTKPSYHLTVSKLQEILGAPEEIDQQWIVYNLKVDGKTEYQLLIEQSEGFVLSARLDTKRLQ